MPSLSEPMIREHHFYVATAKSVFAHDKYGIVLVRDPMSLADAARYGLKPLLLYGITAAGTPIRWSTYSLASEPRSFCSVLQEAWQLAPGLRGRPDVLKVNRHIMAASTSLSATLAPVGVKVVVAEGSDKQFSSCLRTAQGHVFFLGMPVINSLASLCSASLTEHLTRDLNDMWVTSGSDKLEVVVRVERWSRLPVQEMGVKLPENMDWLPGPWLSSWDANLPATSPRYYYNDSMDKTKWLILGHDDDGKSLLDGEYQIENDYNYLARESCKRVLPCWPNTPAQIAQAAGLTGRQLQWFLSGRVQLNGQEQDKLMNVLSVELDMDGYYITSGPCVLIANNDRKIALVYEEISNGGDLDFSFEAVPEKANADPSWRYLLFQRCCGEPSIIMIPRGSKVSEHVDNDLFINFQGIKAVPDALYRDVVSTCARACEDPDENKAEMEAFGRRNLNLLQKYDRVNYLR